MGKNQKRKPKSKRGRKNSQQKSIKSKSIFFFITIIRFWLWIFGLVGTFITFYSFLPQMDVLPSASLNSNNIFSAPFVVKNNNLYSVYDVDVLIHFKKLLSGSREQPSMVMGTNRRLKLADKLESKHSTFFFANLPFFPVATNKLITQAEVIISVEYSIRIASLNFQKKTTSQFVGFQAKDGVIWHETHDIK